jgi:Family of unknown function (DUF5309)
MFKRFKDGSAVFVNPFICHAVKGVFTSDSGIIGDPKGDFAAALLQEVPNGTAPFFALSSGMNTENATDTIIHWFEELHLSGRTTLAENVDGSETAIDVADASSYVAGVILLIESTAEMVFVTSVSGNTVTVVRGFAGTTASAAGVIGDGVQRIGTAYEEASSKPIAVANQGYPRFNYMQVFRNTWNISGTAQAVDYYTGSKAAKTRRDASLMHAEDIERSLLFGRKVTGVVNGVRFSMMDGLRAQITTNVVPAGGTTDWTDIDAFLRSVFEKNIKGKPNERIALGGNGALSVLNDIARIEGQIMISVGQTDFGLNVNRWITPYGNITLLTHPLMVENPLWTKDMDVIHPGAVTIKWLRRTFEDNYDRDGTRAGVDADFGVYTSELSLKYGLERTGGRFTGLTAGAAVPP